jgi:osmoprotectant transport system permease protein
MHKSVLLVFMAMITANAFAQDVVIGSKTFTESRILAEIMAAAIEAETDLEVERRTGLGGTLICFEALKTGAVDIYPEYTGTIRQAILDRPGDEVADELDAMGIALGAGFGFGNSYVLVASPGLGLTRISDLKNRTDLRLGFSNEFVKRGDGFPALNRAYELNLPPPDGMDHGLAYRALAEGQIDVTDAYETDGKLKTFDFSYLEDDLDFFPEYRALPLFRKEILRQYPELYGILDQIDLDEATMRSLNFLVEVEGQSPAQAAHYYLSERGMISSGGFNPRTHPIVNQTIEHLQLTFLATFIAILIAVPAGIGIAFRQKWASGVLSATGVIQTIPSLALLGFMIPLFGIGFLPAVIALFLYALLPILRNTYTGLQDTDPMLVEAGRAMGMTNMQILAKVRLPLAASVIMAGIRTALTINIGTATLAAFIGAGGLGESIITGINLNDNSLILQGAIPAAVLALIADRGMALIEKRLKPGTG